MLSGLRGSPLHDKVGGRAGTPVKPPRSEHQHQHEYHQPNKQQGSSNSNITKLVAVNRLITEHIARSQVKHTKNRKP